MPRFMVEVSTTSTRREGGLRSNTIDMEARDKWDAHAKGKRRGHEMNPSREPRVRVYQYVKTDTKTVA